MGVQHTGHVSVDQPPPTSNPTGVSSAGAMTQPPSFAASPSGGEGGGGGGGRNPPAPSSPYRCSCWLCTCEGGQIVWCVSLTDLDLCAINTPIMLVAESDSAVTVTGCIAGAVNGRVPKTWHVFRANKAHNILDIHLACPRILQCDKLQLLSKHEWNLLNAPPPLTHSLPSRADRQTHRHSGTSDAAVC